MTEVNIKEIVEALIMASDDPLSLDKISKIFNSNNHQIEMKELREVVAELTNDYSERALELKEVASGLRFQVKPEFSYWISKLHEERPPKYSRALLETLALIAYRQPTTRSEIEDVRGVSVGSNIVRTLLDHEWVKVVGHKEVPGRPALFATTKKFLDHFNLKHLNELPPLEEFTEDVASEALVEGSDVDEVQGGDDDMNEKNEENIEVVVAVATDEFQEEDDGINEEYEDYEDDGVDLLDEILDDEEVAVAFATNKLPEDVGDDEDLLEVELNSESKIIDEDLE